MLAGGGSGRAAQGRAACQAPTDTTTWAALRMRPEPERFDDPRCVGHVAADSKRAVKWRSVAGWGSVMRYPRSSSARTATAATTSMT